MHLAELLGLKGRLVRLVLALKGRSVQLEWLAKLGQQDRAEKVVPPASLDRKVRLDMLAHRGLPDHLDRRAKRDHRGQLGRRAKQDHPAVQQVPPDPRVPSASKGRREMSARPVQLAQRVLAGTLDPRVLTGRSEQQVSPVQAESKDPPDQREMQALQGHSAQQVQQAQQVHRHFGITLQLSTSESVTPSGIWRPTREIFGIAPMQTAATPATYRARCPHSGT